MPRSINQGFEDFLIKLKATASESDMAKQHRASIEACLKSNFGLKRFVRIGSFGNGTNVSGYSDVDYLASIPTNQLTQSSTYSLAKVRTALDARFPATGVRVNCPAVAVPFGKYRSEDTEVVPADYVQELNGFKVYEIADGDGVSLFGIKEPAVYGIEEPAASAQTDIFRVWILPLFGVFLWG